MIREKVQERKNKSLWMNLKDLRVKKKEANEEAKALRKKFAQENENLVIQERAAKPSSTNIFSTVSTPAKASSTNLFNTVSIPVSTTSAHEGLSLSDPTNPEEDDSEIPPFEDIYQNSTDGRQAIGTSGFIEISRLIRGVVVRNKARLVAPGLGMEEGSLQSPSSKYCQREFLVTMLEKILTGNPQQEVVNFLAGDSFLGNDKKSRPCGYFYYRSQNMLLLPEAVVGQVLWIQIKCLDYGFNSCTERSTSDNEKHPFALFQFLVVTIGMLNP
ncbi:hypothetical protein Tco_0804370 [Tanacetum coccineum]|uniref:Uncharacterized protein n=1 Tax=Tanacetum coccineum TaxID=301880 RepID=A0ABQ5A806_9ASTR